MAGHARYTALLDACVLYLIVMCDSLMSLAVTGLFAAKWTTRIESEWLAALEADRPDLMGRLDYRRDQMRCAVPDWEVPEQAWQLLTGRFVLPDPDDVHVLAAAIAGHADCILTTNVRDFPSVVVDPYGIEVVHPDRFIVNQWDLDDSKAVAAFRAMRVRSKKPAATATDFAQAIERGGLPATASRPRDVAELI